MYSMLAAEYRLCQRFNALFLVPLNLGGYGASCRRDDGERWPIETHGLRETSPRQARQQFDPVARKGKAAHPFAGLHGQGSFTHRLVPYSSYHGGEERVMPVKV